MSNLTTLWRPVGYAEYELLVDAGMRRWPPRLPHQTIFYPVLNRDYAAQIARDWNTTDEVSGFVGIVTEFDLDAAYAARFERKVVGANNHEELWVPAEQLDALNDHIIGSIRVIEVFYGDRYDGSPLTGSGTEST
jgi:hypothetical protein